MNDHNKKKPRQPHTKPKLGHKIWDVFQLIRKEADDFNIHVRNCTKCKPAHGEYCSEAEFLDSTYKSANESATRKILSEVYNENQRKDG